jgi:hypothetical protein
MKQLEKLTNEERDILFTAPVLLSVLESCSNNEVNKDQKADAIRLAHLKTFTADPLLIPFYIEVEKNFQKQFELAVKEYTPLNDTKRNEIKSKMKKINLILGKLDKDYADKLLRSFEKYERHVRKAGHSVVQDFIFPVPLPGFTD